MAERKEFNLACDPDIETCATDAVFKQEPKDITSYALLGAYVYFSFFAPLMAYWIRIAVR